MTSAAEASSALNITTEQAAMSASDPWTSDILLQIFNRHKDATLALDGISCPMCLRLALVEAGAPCIPCDDVEDRSSHFKRFVAPGTKCVSLDAFKKACAVPALLPIFNKYKGTKYDGLERKDASTAPSEDRISCSMCLDLALLEYEACISRCQHRTIKFKRFDVCGDKHLTFNAFREAVDVLDVRCADALMSPSSQPGAFAHDLPALTLIFSKYKDTKYEVSDCKDASSAPSEDGISCPMCLHQALLEAKASCIPRDDAEDLSHFKRFDVHGRRWLTFDAFKKAVDAPDALESSFSSADAVVHTSSPAAMSPASPPNVSILEQAAKDAVRRSTSEYLREIFEKHIRKDASSAPSKSGISCPISLWHALDEAGALCIPRDGDCVNCFYNRFDVLSDNCVTFDAFKRAAEAPDGFQSWLDEGVTFKLGAFAPALRIAANLGNRQSESSDFLEKISNLNDENIKLVVDASAGAIQQLLTSKRDELRKVFYAKQHAEKAEESMQLTVKKMATGSANDFHGGLASRVGHPSLNFEVAMQVEHCHPGKGTESFEFETGNPYNITTTSAKEWNYVLGNEIADFVVEKAKPEKEPFKRRIRDIAELLKQYPYLSKAEVISVILYSGPMFVMYNGILRQYTNEAKVYKHFKKQNNLFPTTIHVLASALQKIARHSRISADTPLFRGLGGSGKFTLELPDSFHNPDEKFLTGYTDYGFQSFTADKDTALTYSGVYQHKPHACMLEIHPNSIDRAADISEFSQFPMEKEFTFVPCSFVQKDGKGRYEAVTWPESGHDKVGFLTVVPARVNANIKTETVEQIESRKKEMHMTAFEVLRVELDNEIDEIKTSKKVDDSEMQKLRETIFKACDQVLESHKKKGHGEYNDPSKYSALVREMLDTKKMAISKVKLLYPDRNPRKETEFELSEVLEQPLRTAYRTLVSKMLQEIHQNQEVSKEQRMFALKLCKLKGFVKTDVNDMNELQEKPLATFAADGCSTEDMKLLIIAGANVNSRDRNFQTPLYLAAQYGHVEIVDFLLDPEKHKLSEKAADPNIFTNIDSEIRSPLHIASFYGHSIIVVNLLKYGANVDARDARRASSLLLAAQQGHFDCVNVLIENKANVDLADEDGRTPLFMAAQQGHPDCIRSLIKAGAKVNRPRNDGYLPMHATVAMGSECVKVLAELGSVKLSDEDGWSFEAEFCSASSSPSSLSSPMKSLNLKPECRSARDLWQQNLHGVHSVRKKKGTIQEEDAKFVGFDRVKKVLLPELAQEECANERITEFCECLKMVRAAIKKKPDLCVDEADVRSTIESWRQSLTEIHAKKMYEEFIKITVSSAIDCLNRCLKDPDPDVVEQALTELGNVAGNVDETEMRDAFLRHFKQHTNPLLEAMEDMGISQLLLLRKSAETLSKFCETEPVPEFYLISPALPTVTRLILYEDKELFKHAFSVLKTVTTTRDGVDQVLDLVLKTVPLEHLVQLMSYDEGQFLSGKWLPFVKFLGHVVANQDSNIAICAGILPLWRNMLFHPDPRFRAEACLSISNVLLEPHNRAKVLALEDIIPRVVELMKVKAFAAAANSFDTGVLG